MLEQASELELPMVLLKAYTPLRQKESSLVEWQDMDFEMGSLVVWADRAKTRQSRMIHLPAELCRRLRPLAREYGPIYPYGNGYEVSPRIARKAGVTWIRNGWRCTVISHLQALLNNLGRVAEEAGTSVQKLKSNYLLPGIRPEMARAYFGLRQTESHPLEPGYQREELLPLENVIPCEFRLA
jgi:integrase